MFLAALMVFSVFAGTVAFTGSAAAAQPVYQGNAVHYLNSSDYAVVEVPFAGDVSDNSLTTSNFTLYDDGDEVSNYQVEYRSGAVYLVVSGDGDTNYKEGADDVIASTELTVEISDQVTDGSGSSIDNPGEKSIAFASDTVEVDLEGTFPTTGLESNVTAWKGSTIAFNVSNSTTGWQGNQTDVTIEGEDNSYFSSGSTGVNSSVYTFNTNNREVGTYKLYIQGNDTASNRTYIEVRDLNLGISADDLSVTTEDTIEGTVSAADGNRPVEIELLDSSGDTVATDTATLNGQGEYDFSFDAQNADSGSALDPGNYTVQVTDNSTAITAETSTITVSEAGDDDASFASNTITEHRGDVFEFTVNVDGTDTAVVSFGTQDQGVVSNATFVDDDGDGQVTAYLNTTALVQPETTGTSVYSLPSDSDDTIDSQNISTNVSNLIDAGEYDLTVRPETNQPGDTTGIATVVLRERNTTRINTWTMPNAVSVSDLEGINEALADGDLTQTGTIAQGDKVVHAIHSSGLEGLLNAQHNEQITSEFLGEIHRANSPIDFDVEQAEPGANQQAWNLSLGSDNTTVVADGNNDTYYVIVNTESVTRNGSSNGIPEDETLEANFTVKSNDAGTFDYTPSSLDDDENEETLQTYDVVEEEVTINQPYNVSQAANQTISGTTTFAPGTELNLRVRSTQETSPSFLKTATVVVQSDRTWSTTFDFSNQNVGDTYDITVKDNLLDSDVTESGTVVEAVMTDTATATPEPDTATATPEPDTATATPEPDTATATPEPDTATATPEPDTATATPEPDTATATPEPDTATPTSTPTSTPGFGVVVALTALIAAALLAVRREN